MFKRFFQAAEGAQLDPPAGDAYEQSLKYYRDMKNLIDTAVSAPTTTSRYFPLADANGNAVTYSDDAGNVQAHYTYDAFGNTVSQSGVMADDFRFRFSSKYLDDETGLYYYGYRYLSPALGRWMNRDPIISYIGLYES